MDSHQLGLLNYSFIEFKSRGNDANFLYIYIR